MARRTRKPDVALLREIVRWVEYQELLPPHRREWNQENWWQSLKNTFSHGPRRGQVESNVCQASFCVAGYLVIKYDPEFVRASMINTDRWVSKAGKARSWQRAASDLLDITESQSDELFNWSNTAADIRRIAEGIARCKL